MEDLAALLVVDVQVDFCPGGSLAIREGDTIIPVINRYLELFRKKHTPIFATRDWHPPVTTHFRQFGGVWPAHCVQWTGGAAFHPALRLPEEAIVVSKGMDPTRDDYSSFEAELQSGVSLQEELKKRRISHIFICGLATDYCVRDTSIDALAAGFQVTVLVDAVKGVDLKEGDSARALEEIRRAGGELTELAMIERRQD